MTNVVLHHHLGLGDHFICNGLVHSLLERNNWEELHLVCKPHYSKTVKHLYEDFSNIKLLVVKDEYTEPVEFAKNNNMEMLRIGFEHIDANNFENSFYNQCMVDIDAEYTQFILPSRLDASEEFYNTVTEKLGQDYIFVHKECSIKNYDLKIDSNLPQHIAEKNDTDDILDYVHTICKAKEIHVINSGINNLVFQLYYKGFIETDKIYYHAIRRIEDGGFPIKVLPGIEIVEYE